jgi:hypothetical protein
MTFGSIPKADRQPGIGSAPRVPAARATSVPGGKPPRDSRAHTDIAPLDAPRTSTLDAGAYQSEAEQRTRERRLETGAPVLPPSESSRSAHRAGRGRRDAPRAGEVSHFRRGPRSRGKPERAEVPPPKGSQRCARRGALRVTRANAPSQRVADPTVGRTKARGRLVMRGGADGRQNDRRDRSIRKDALRLLSRRTRSRPRSGAPICGLRS